MCVGEREVPLVEGVTGRLVDHAQFPSVHVAARNVQVWLPPGYASGAVRYPVLYMHDGQNLFDPARSYTGVDWGVDETMTRLIGEGAVREAIVVGVWNTPKRFEEYMPRKAVGEGSRDSGIEEMAPIAAGDLLSDAYLRFLVEELKPFVDRRYRTLAGPQDTMIMGSSMGGLISLYALAEYPQVFGAAAGLSTHWPAGDGAVIEYLSASMPGPGLHRVYFDYGTRGVDARYAPFQARMDAVMRGSGYRPGRQWTTHRFEGAEHSESAWRRRLHVPLLFLLATGMPTSTNAEAIRAARSPPCRP
jgi:predicted alpha/beta superfamily hydrolase